MAEFALVNKVLKRLVKMPHKHEHEQCEICQYWAANMTAIEVVLKCIELAENEPDGGVDFKIREYFIKEGLLPTMIDNTELTRLRGLR